MRLLNATEMQLFEFFGKDIPPYAILSHTWGDDEVTFQDIQNGEAHSKQAFVKIAQCCEEAVRDGIEFVWVDTCCIDKTSSSELSEAINSMFQWYRLAIRCYAYLSDLPSQLSEEELRTMLPSCRWFSRGWTLQELLAPRDLHFFAQDWTRLGERGHWASTISTATGIHEGALSGNVEDIRAFSVAQKFSWASKRQTTREEDIAYCLMGLFNVYMPLLYGEGSQAFIRLQEEIIKKSDDQTIFVSQGDMDYQYRGLLASSPREFEYCSTIVPFRHWKSSRSYEMTNAGLCLTTSLLETKDDSKFLFIPQCYDQRAPERMLGITLVRLSPAGDQFAKINGLQYHMGIGCHFLPQRTIYIRNDSIRPEAHTLSETGRLVHFCVFQAGRKEGYQITQVWPAEQWDSHSQMLRPPKWSNQPDQKSNRPDPSLFNWSWHAALLLSSPRTSDSGVSGNEEFIVIIGYNGRDDQCWCEIDFRGSKDLEGVWINTPYSGATKMSSVDRNEGASTVHVSLLGLDGGLLPKAITSGWKGGPLMALIRID